MDLMKLVTGWMLYNAYEYTHI